MHWMGSTAALRRPRLDVRQQILLTVALVATLAIPITAPLTLPDLFPSAAGSDNTCYKFTTAERAFTSNMNQERKQRGLGTMKLDPELSRVAMRHTKEMTSANTLMHTTTTALTRRVTNWVTLGENVGVGAEVATLHAAFMNSPAHKDNILHSTFNNVGVGVGKANGRMWVTVIFEARSNPGTRLAMPNC